MNSSDRDNFSSLFSPSLDRRYQIRFCSRQLPDICVIDGFIDELFVQESKEKGWYSIAPLPSLVEEKIEVSYKKVHDGNPLRLWKCSTEIEAPPVEVLHRIVNGWFTTLSGQLPIPVCVVFAVG